MQLSPSQKQAVEYIDGPQIILAGAGSGKTRVIVAKAQYLIEQKGLSPESLLIITYSTKTQAELEERFSEIDGTIPEIRTFHSFGMEIVSEFGGLVGLPAELTKASEYRLREYQKAAIAELSDSILLNTNQPEKVYSDLTSFISRAKDELIQPEIIIKKAETVLAELAPDSDDDETIIERNRWTKILEAAKIYRSYERIKTERLNSRGGGIDYGDMMVLSHKLLKDHKTVGAILRKRFKYVLVDEFQDTNFAQVELLHHLGQDKIGITVVGDDDQAIYRFRGASFGSFKLYEKLFLNSKAFKLEENYRSTVNIVSGAQSSIEIEPDARFDPDKTMVSAAGAEGEKIAVRICPDDFTEAESIAREINQLLESERYSTPGSIAVLFRVRRHKDLLIQSLQRRDIQFYYDQNDSEADSVPAQLLIQIYEFLTDSNRRDLLMSLISQFIPELSLGIQREIGYRLGRDKGEPLGILNDYSKNIDDELKEKIYNFQKFIETLKNQQGKLDPVRLLERIASDSGIFSTLIIEGKITDETALHEVAGILRAAAEFSHETGSNSHSDFLIYLNWWRKSSDNSMNLGFKTDAPVILQTVHGSKGLEYPVVFVMGLSNRKFPTSNKPSSVNFPTELYNEELPEGDYKKQEERRLFYVAMTRAKERLYLYGVQKKGTRISQFVQELLKSDKFEMFGEKQEIEKSKEIELAAIGPDRISSGAKNFIMPVTDDANMMSIVINRLWDTLSLKAQSESEYEKLKSEFIQNLKLSFDSVSAKIDTGKYEKPKSKPENEIANLSYSDIESFGTCPLQFYYRKMLRMPSPVGAQMIFGNIMHSTLENAGKEMVNDKVFTADDLKTKFDFAWNKVTLDDPDQKERLKIKAETQLDNFIVMQSSLSGKPVEMEKTFKIELSDIILTGKIDRIDKTESGYEIIDYKTGKRDDKKLKNDYQLPIYSLACKSLYDQYPKRLMYMFLNEEEPYIMNFDDDGIDQIIENILQKADDIKKSDFTATPGFHCGFCGYKGMCPARK